MIPGGWGGMCLAANWGWPLLGCTQLFLAVCQCALADWEECGSTPNWLVWPVQAAVSSHPHLPTQEHMCVLFTPDLTLTA